MDSIIGCFCLSHSENYSCRKFAEGPGFDPQHFQEKKKKRKAGMEGEREGERGETKGRREGGKGKYRKFVCARPCSECHQEGNIQI